jgi:hypothetical protein
VTGLCFWPERRLPDWTEDRDWVETVCMPEGASRFPRRVRAFPKLRRAFVRFRYSLHLLAISLLAWCISKPVPALADETGDSSFPDFLKQAADWNGGRSWLEAQGLSFAFT